ncbi:regulatory protein GntR HTH [Beutenbergia cavernae DSM 12333]|uniref:Regulatory protein GntR HTH n=1 Tax=Beutenbergia cavernae (strain ATCC BAA-8 / DSM 12333 / CCUG 43141 / JCM 11478 / NBRC 16432 / NCIMB 13614 / HKI 0122) TaxID=471853 RepID=C5C3V1_BEUC1|nr:GntR family transcriptional regulator [Beutenbergia cavernae]ACQ82010.1 regulatory protein GntR HTH [Beutenbergia cavernae DSM 12333]
MTSTEWTGAGVDDGAHARAAGPRTRSAQTAAQIKDLILVNGLRPGDAMPTEAELGTALGVSRSSLREAMRTLATLGIVEVRHGYGTYVGEMSLDALVETLVFRGALQPGDDLRALREIIEIRQALDLAMAERVTGAVAGTHDPGLWAMVREMVRLSADGCTFTEQDRAFHTDLLSRIDNSIIAPLVGAFWDVHTAVMPRLGVSLPTDLVQTAGAHEDMLRSAESGDVGGYRAAVLRHYEPLVRSLDQHVPAAGR